MAATATKKETGAGVAAKKERMTASEKEKKLTPVPPPNEKLHRGKIEAETKAIDELKVKINDLQKQINSTMGGRDEYNRKKNEMRERLDDLTAQSQKLETERKELVEQIEAKQREGREMKANVQNLKKSIGYVNEDDIDQKIKDIETSMMTTSMPLKDEKKMMTRIAQLKANRPLVGRYATLEASANSFEGSSIIPLKARLDVVREKLNAIRKEKRDESEKYRDMVQERNSSLGPVRDLIDERDEYSKIMSEHFSQRRSAQEELNQEMARWSQYQRELRAIRNEKYREDKARRAIENERMALERQLEKVDAPTEDDISLLEQTIKYTRKLLQERDGLQEEKAESKEDKTTVVPNTDGLPLLPKSKRDEEFYFAPKSKKEKRVSQKVREKSKSLKHDIGTMSYFESCGVSAPASFDEIDDCLKRLEEKLEERKRVQQVSLDGAAERRQNIQDQLDALDVKIKAEFQKASADENAVEGSVEE